MSALGQKRTSDDHLGYVRFAPESGHWRVGHRMSALCQKRTFAGEPRHVRFVPEADISWACYSITSSARAISCRGTSMPSVLAVLRLMISSTLVTCWTGKSPGFSPLSIRPAYWPERRCDSVRLPL